ncbi:hypothetical protein M758_3G071400 [Ceratodon purpureus]|nr:hypothetical protein M758_3G071400 [Ceratodon purpureus]
MQPIILNEGWVAARASDVELSGRDLTTSQCPSLKSDSWIEAVVPGTVLTTLLKNDLIPDPFYGLNNLEVPDIGEVGREYYTFWFCNKFKLPSVRKGGKVWLNFRAINYQAEVFLNGFSKLLSKGMFLRHTIDITDWLDNDGENLLAVLVHPPDHPGRIPLEGGQGGDHDIAKDVAAQYVEGWDWICPIRDRNTGIWDAVSIHQTGPVRLVDPHLVATFYNSYTEADLWATTQLANTSSDQVTVVVKLNVSLDDAGDFCIVDHVHTSQDIVLEGNSTISYSLPSLPFKNPALWWPNGMGDQPLYKVDITLEVQGYGETDTWSHLFGFRHIDSYIDPATDGRKFVVNGEPIFIRGGNWIVSDGLLRLSKERYETDVGFHADMNLNMIRIWGGALAERPEFYNACDKRGILVWQEFWITGDCNGRGVEPSDPNWPLDHDLFLTCAYDTVKLLRNHASLALWCGGNEQHPAEDINEALEKNLRIVSQGENPSLSLDGSRLYIQGSLWSGIAAGNGLFRDGPYEIQVPEKYFDKDYYAYAFNPEIGNVGVPKAETIRATFPPEAWDPPATLNGEHPNLTWDYHKYIPYANAQKLVPGQIEAFGEYNGLDDFCEKAQLVNYFQYRALMEGWNSMMWTKYTGVLLWKTQNPWPGLRGQMYDFLLDQTGAFFGLRSACESVHVQLNLRTYNIEIVNTGRESLSDHIVEASVFDVNGENPHTDTFKRLAVPAKTTTTVGNVPLFTSIDDHPMYFLLLKCLTSSGELVSRNFYWLHPVGGSYSQLAGDFRTRKIPIKTSTTCSVNGDFYLVNIRVENSETKSDAAVAFGLYFTVIDADSKALEKRILPVTYSDNWFSLVPNEALDVQVSFKVQNRKVRPKLLLKGWNVADTEISCS